MHSLLGRILDHWEMRSIRNRKARSQKPTVILDHWEMRSIRNKYVFVCQVK